MEHVEGMSLSDYCVQNRLSLRGRLELFLKVCAAVEHAHQQLVVHRDLKPSNILVDGEGTPKLLDFGIAKLLAPEESAGVTLSAGGMRPLTPEYASPEQVSGEPVAASQGRARGESAAGRSA
jgi:serine/threonine protein kinase